ALATGETVTGRQVAARAGDGDPAATQVLARAGEALGRALAGLVALLDPQAVVVTGGAAAALLVADAPVYTAELLPAWADEPLLPAALGDDAVAVGAARLGMEDSTQCPEHPSTGCAAAWWSPVSRCPTSRTIRCATRTCRRGS